MIKSLFRLSLRIVTGFVQSLIKLCVLDWAVLDYSTICRRQKHIDIAISYQKSRDGLHLLVDSTGLKFLGEGEWKRKKHQPEYRRQWRKLHIGKDPRTLQMLVVQLTTNSKMNYFERLIVSAGRNGKNGQAIIGEVGLKPRCTASNY